jgi:hypothetical protein
VNLHGQAEGGDEHSLAGVEAVAVYVALDVRGYGVLVPAPVGERLGVELKSAARSREAAQDFVVNLDADEAAAFGVRVEHGDGDDVRRRGLRSPRVDAPEAIRARVVQLFLRDLLLVERADLSAYLERAVAAHEL